MTRTSVSFSLHNDDRTAVLGVVRTITPVSSFFLRRLPATHCVELARLKGERGGGGASQTEFSIEKEKRNSREAWMEKGTRNGKPPATLTIRTQFVADSGHRRRAGDSGRGTESLQKMGSRLDWVVTRRNGVQGRRNRTALSLKARVQLHQTS